MFSKTVPVLVIAAVLASANAIDVYTPTNMTGIGTDCATQICSSCGEGEEQLFELGKCCPDCVPAGCFETECPLPKCLEGQTLTRHKGECCRTCTLDCSAVSCFRPICEEGEELVVPDGECCPQCQRECTIKGQFFSSCASRCPRTCNPPPDLFCPTVCVEGCKCPSGQVVDTTKNACVSEDECPPNVISDPCDACPEGKVCEKRVNPCQIPPCPVSITCKDPDSCSDCPKGTLCRTEPRFCIDPPCGPDFVRCLDPDDVCSLEPETGPCRGNFYKFFYNSTTDQCELFIYGGCGGNDNRFDTRSECISACDAINPCIGVVCERGSSCIVDDQTGRAFCEPSCDLDNGGCPKGTICERRVNPCQIPPCPVSVTCRNPDPCSATGFICERGSSCRVDDQTGKAFCEPSCDLDNGGCRKDQTCELQIVQCLNPPCPLKVRCIDPVPVDPCATVRCANGYQCKVFKSTGEAYCQPNCNLNNGGCLADQECRLKPLICVRAPCPPLIECVERTTECPPTCSKEFCTRKGNQRAMCSNLDPQELPGCTGSCHLTYCHACYYDEESRSPPEYCPECKNLQNYLKDSRCFRHWANCVRRDQELFGHWAERTEENFRCHNPSCSLHEVMNSESDLPFIYK